MGLIIGFMAFLGFAIFFVMRSGNNAQLGSAFGGMGIGLLPNGTPARAILLQVSMTGTSRRYSGQRYEVRSAYLDIEEPGQPPYELNTQLYIPSNLVRDSLPGSTMEVRVDGASQNMVVVIGPDVGYTQAGVRTS